MVKNHFIPQVFGIAHGLVLLGIAAAVAYYRHRDKNREKAVTMKVENVYLRGAIRRTPLATSSAGEKKKPPPSPSKPIAVESHFPSWDKNTPPHLILEVAPEADAETIQAAYKRILKEYHPDRFAHWGAGYQTRAHHVLLLAQQARDKMLGKK
jgi:DnaJ-domain-containing protein 1